MNAKLIEEIADAVLYEGYLLYPYRMSAVKNQKRWNFGVLYPRAYSEAQMGADAWTMRAECLVRSNDEPSVSVRARFLRLRSDGAVPREQLLNVVDDASRLETPEVVIDANRRRLSGDLYKLGVTLTNPAPFRGVTREDALADSLVSVHLILGLDRGEFVSLLEPPDALREAAATCKNEGLWPVLVGEDGARDAMLASPIILYDYPKIAPESPGALFDGTEIDEILTLRILTMTEQEKAEMAQADERTREILRRTESMPPEQFMKLHGAVRGLQPEERL